MALAGPAPLGVGTFSGFSLPPPPPPLGSNLTFLTFSPLALADEAAALAAALAAAADSGFPEVRGVCLGVMRGVGLESFFLGGIERQLQHQLQHQLLHAERQTLAKNLRNSENPNLVTTP